MQYIHIEFMDGSSEVFSFPQQAPSSAAQRMRLEDFVQGQFAIIACENEVLVFPLANIKALKFSLPPEAIERLHLPPSAIRGAERH